MTRTKLPDRRPNETFELTHRGHLFFVSFGRDPDTGQILEVFGSTPRAGSDFSALLMDACVILSLGLQAGLRPEALGKSLGWSPVLGDPDRTSEPSSIIGVIVEAMVKA